MWKILRQNHGYSIKIFKSTASLVHKCNEINLEDIFELVTHECVIGSLKDRNGNQQNIENGKIKEDFIGSLDNIGKKIGDCIQDINLPGSLSDIERFIQDYFKKIREFA